jgi:XTP/dITP diphosphohydrolase
MNKIIFASNNLNKASEIKQMLNLEFEIITLKEAGIFIDIPEPHNTFALNAHEKSATIHKMTGMDCFGEDSGLEVDALKGAPGVQSACFSGVHGDDAANNEKLLSLLENVQNRSAQFKTVISLILNGQNFFFEGTCQGEIAKNMQGFHGFGYDPLFIPNGYNNTFAELNPDIKNQISHRKKAVSKMIAFLLQETLNKKNH